MKKQKNETFITDENIKSEEENLNSSSDFSYKELNAESSEQNETIVEKIIQQEIEIIPEVSEEDKIKLNQSQETVSKQKSKKKKLLSIFGMLINIGIVLVILLVQIFGSEENFMSLRELFSSGFNGWCFLLCIVLFFGVNITMSLRTQLIIKYTTKKNRPALAYKVSAIGRYYDSITPLGTGGQPFQVYYLTKRGVDGSSALSIPLGNYVVSMFVFVFISLILMLSSITSVSVDNATSVLVSTASWIGVSLNFLLVFLVALLSISKTIGQKIVTSVLKFLQKIKVIKNYEKQYDKVNKFVNDYQSTMRKYAKSKWTFLVIILLSVLNLVLHYSIPFMVYSTLNGSIDFSIWWSIAVKCVMVDLAASFIPLPGGSGAAELSFAALFGSLFTGGKFFWALILWRILSYYGYIAQGLIIQIYDFLWGNKRHEWVQKKWALEAESVKFKNQHYAEFEVSMNRKKSKTKIIHENKNFKESKVTKKTKVKD